MIYLGADHNGFQLKQQLKKYLERKGVAYRDLGAHKLVARDDYPDFAISVAKKISGRDQGLLICGSGHGMAIAANKVAGVRAALCSSPFSAKMARRDDHANVLVLASWETTLPQAQKIVSQWFKSEPSKIIRYVRRINKIKRLER
jgi:ribose 5-phosphate isomerase B